MTSLLIGLWVWQTVLAAQESPKDFPPAERAMRKRCAGVGEEIIQQVRDFALETSARMLSIPKGGSHGAVITRMRKWANDEKLAEKVPDACLAEIVRLAYASRVKEQKTRQEAEAKAAQIATWNALNATEQSWVLRARGTVPRLTCNTLAVGAVGVLKNQVNVLRVDSRGFVIGGLMCDPIVTTTRIASRYSGGGSIGGIDASRTRFGEVTGGMSFGPQQFNDRYETTTTTPPDVCIWISGMDASYLTTGMKLDLSGKPIEVVGTRTSLEVTFGETIFEIRLVPVDPILLSTITPPPGVTIENYQVSPADPPTVTNPIDYSGD